jgi:hypothetical protein
LVSVSLAPFDETVLFFTQFPLQLVRGDAIHSFAQLFAIAQRLVIAL